MSHTRWVTDHIQLINILPNTLFDDQAGSLFQTVGERRQTRKRIRAATKLNPNAEKVIAIIMIGTIVDRHTKFDGRMAELGKTNEPLQAETSGEPADPIAHETNQKIGEVEELLHDFKSKTPPPEKESVFLKEGDYWTIQYHCPA